MNKFTNFYGVDISKDVFDVMDQNGIHSKFANNLQGFKMFEKRIAKNSVVIMEATGVYHVQLADFLYKKAIPVSVVNPLSIKRFIQMNLRRIKTDKADAEMICKYGQMNDLNKYIPSSVFIKEARIITENIDLLIKSRTMFKNRLHAIKHKGTKHRSILISSIDKAIKALDKQVKLLELELKKLIKENYPDLYSRLQTIPGIGEGTAAFMLILTEGFEKFESAKQLICYFGLSPTEKSSGSSVRGSSRISKQGNPKIRNLLFMCSFNACKTNKACRELYQRIVAKGKSKKLALIAVANKLIKQAFAIAKSGLVYDENYRSVNPLYLKK